MFPYFVVLLVVVGLAYFSGGPKKSYGLRQLGSLLALLVLASLAGLRGDSVGADTTAYVGRFDYLTSLGLYWDTWGSAELGYKLLLGLSRRISDDAIALLLITSLVAVTLYLSALNRIAINNSLSLFLFIVFGFYNFHMNGLRQGLALGAFMWALYFIINSRRNAFIATIILGSFFHTSLLLALPSYYLSKVSFSVSSIILSVFGVTIILVGLQGVWSLLEFFDLKYLTYQNKQETGGALLTAFYVIQGLLFLILRSVIKIEYAQDYDKFFNLYFVGALIYLIVYLSGSYVEMNRLGLYFTVTMIFMTLLRIKNNNP